MKTHHHTVSSVHVKEKQVPAIRLSGNWLAELGFKIGRKYIVNEKSGSILLSLILPEDDEA